MPNSDTNFTTDASNVVDFGRIVYIEPNNILKDGLGRYNFTHNPEDYSIFVDLQVDVVDRFAGDGMAGDNVISYTVEWDAKGTKTTLFRGTNGFLTTKALETTFDDLISENNAEAIGINSIDIRYNSWNYPEITIQFTDIRGASLMASSDYYNDGNVGNPAKRRNAEEYASSFFSTFFKFPYPRYTLVVKGFYGRPVSYSLCVSDFKTKFNSSNGCFDITVSFIGYMYGLLTDIPMRLLFAAPYSTYIGKDYWDTQKRTGHFVYADSKIGGTNVEMLKFFEFKYTLETIQENLENEEDVKRINEELQNASTTVTDLQGIKTAYNAFLNEFSESSSKGNKCVDYPTGSTVDENGVETTTRKKLILVASLEAKTCDECNGAGIWKEERKVGYEGRQTYIETGTCSTCKGVGYIFDESCKRMEGKGNGFKSLIENIINYNLNKPEDEKIYSFGYGDANQVELTAQVVYKRQKDNTYRREDNGGEFQDEDQYLLNVIEDNRVLNNGFIPRYGENNPDLKEYLGIYILDITKFHEDCFGKQSSAENTLKAKQEELEEAQKQVYTKVLGFPVTIRNFVDMCLAHLDTLMECVYTCMEEIKKRHRTFANAGLSLTETDVHGNAGTKSEDGREIYLPPFFGYRANNPKTDSFEDAWIGDDPRFANKRELFQEIQLIDGLLNGTLKANEEATANTQNRLQQIMDIITDGGKSEGFKYTLASDYVQNNNPYSGVEDFESMVATFVMRMMLHTVLDNDYPKSKGEYFGKVAEQEAENFCQTGAFDSIKGNNLDDILSGFTEDKFLGFASGKEYINANSASFNVKNMENPPFTKDGDDYIISYGRDNKYVVPVFFNSASKAALVGDDVYSGTSNAGFGISRTHGFPDITIDDNDSKLKEISGEIINKDTGWYFKNKDVWTGYYDYYKTGDYFPSITKSEYVRDNAAWKSNENGNLYKTSDGRVARSPGKQESLQGFFTHGDGWFDNDNGTQHSIVPAESIVNGGDTTVYGLAGSQNSTIFQSYLYLYNYEKGGNESLMARAFLFLHSLPTSSISTLRNAAKTLIGKTYTPSVSCLPMSLVLFIGALYWREKYCSDEGVADVVDFCDGYYKTAGWRNLIAVNYSSNQMPFCPIKSKEEDEYCEIISKKVEEEFEQKIKESFEKKTDIPKNDEYALVGFWNVPEDVKKKFIEKFTDWVSTTFSGIEKELMLKDTEKNIFSAKDIETIRGEITEGVYFDAKGNLTNKGKSRFADVPEIINVQKSDTSTTAYNEYIKYKFDSSLWFYNARLEPSKDEYSLMVMWRKNTEPVKSINKILTTAWVVSVPMPRLLMTRDVFSPLLPNERASIRVSEGALTTAWMKFRNRVIERITKKATEEEKQKEKVQNVAPADVSSEVKLSLYETLKNLHDKWLVATSEEKYKFSNDPATKEEYRQKGKTIQNNFNFINTFYEDVGDEIKLNLEKLPEQIKTVMTSKDTACSLYSFMYDVASNACLQMLALPIFNDMSNPEYVAKMFTPMPFETFENELVDVESQYVFYYSEEPSKNLNISDVEESNNSDKKYKFADDSFTVVTEFGHPDVANIPKTFLNEGPEKKRVPVFGVTFAKQNQSFFKNISVSMDSPKTTEVAIYNTLDIANKFRSGTPNITSIGQELFPIYSNYSYECTVEMMGCACIMPLMYFQLNNIPMFKGTYIIYNVNHTISPGNMTTSFSGQRLSRFRKKRNEHRIVSSNNTSGKESGTTTEGVGNPPDGCYTCGGHKLINEDTYAEISRITGISDRSTLRAVQFAETRYDGGFFKDGNLRIQYNPGFNTENFTLGNTYEESMQIIDDNGQGIEFRYTIAGAFGVPTDCYKALGFDKRSDLLDNERESFHSQGIIFANLLKTNEKMIKALNDKDWDAFAKLYKGTGSDAVLPNYGVYCHPGGENGLKEYVEMLKQGYNESFTANADNKKESVIADIGESIHYDENETESNEYAKKYPFNVRKAITKLMASVSWVYQGGSTYTIDYHNVVNGESLRGDGTKEETQSIHRCATYVKKAMHYGGLPYFECDGGECEEHFDKRGWYELYASNARISENDYSRLEPGDVCIIENFVKTKYGHVCMWTGSKWYSDYRQDSGVRTYPWDSVTKKHWDGGGYHFLRYRNRTTQ